MTVEVPLLRNGEIVVTHRLVDASNATLLGTIEGLGKVIYKPVAGERPLWDFPEGTLASREYATYLLSDFLHLDLVPMTLLREGPFGFGMVQQWIEIDESVDLLAFGESQNSQLRMMALFDAMINNTDRKFGHILIDHQGRLYGCDHGVTFHHEFKLRTVLWQFAGDIFTDTEESLLADIEAKSDQITALFDQYLSEIEIAAFFERVAVLRRDQAFPLPNPNWPAVPWPPV